MMTPAARRLSLLGGAALVAALASTALQAQGSKSAALAKELTDLMQQQKLDSVAARHPSAPDEFVAALYFPGQLLVVSAKTVAPSVLNEKLARREFRDVYIDLNSASIPESRVMFTDGNADGLRPDRDPNLPFDMFDANDKSIRFDGNWREDRMSEKDYMAAFSRAETAYVEALTALVSALKKGS